MFCNTGTKYVKEQFLVPVNQTPHTRSSSFNSMSHGLNVACLYSYRKPPLFIK